jgi:hypothetical protein
MGEKVCDLFPGSRFSKWWRRNIVMEDPSEK